MSLRPENHISNYYLLLRLAKKLNEILSGQSLDHCHSINKNEVVLSFTSLDLKVFLGEQSFAVVYEKKHTPPKSIPQFANLNRKKFLTCEVTPHDRSCRMDFEDNLSLFFLMYGRNGNVLCYDQDKQTGIFRTQFEKHLNIKRSDFDAFKVPGFEEYQKLRIEKPASEAIVSLFKGFSNGMYEYLNSRLMPAHDVEKEWDIIKDFETLLTTGTIDVGEDSEKTVFLNLLPVADAYDVLISTSDVSEALKVYSSRYFYIRQFIQKKTAAIGFIKNKLDKMQMHIAAAKKHLQYITDDQDYRKLADILMANLHQIPAGAEKVRLYDFYKDKEIEIPLKRGLPPQNWAEKLYRKAKNQEIDKLKTAEKLKTLEEESAYLIKELSQIDAISDLKSLKAEVKPENKVQENLPFRHFESHGYDIYVGKDSAGNDKLTFGFAHKEDLWLHASGVSGSHVVIRHKQKESFPMPVIQRAAAIAAYYSKSKGSILVPVKYTLRKFVRKPKGAATGAVIVEKENMIMVAPGLS